MSWIFCTLNCGNNVSNLTLVISGIYDVGKRNSEYYEYFESFQPNIQLENGYLGRIMKYSFSDT